MANLKDALLKAFTDQGLEPPSVKDTQRVKVVLAKGSKGSTQLVRVSYGTSEGRRAPGKANLPPDNAQARKSQGNSGRTSPPVPPQGSIPTAAGAQPHRTFQAVVKKGPPVPPVLKAPPPQRVRVDRGAKCLVSFAQRESKPLLDLDGALGTLENIGHHPKRDVHELSLGLDFGTSSVKVVIGDLASDKAYAIPFLEAEGIEAYLMPSRLYESPTPSAGPSAFSLVDGDVDFRDLKLGLLGEPQSIARQVEVIAFLALVIQRARAWLFTSHASTYRSIECRWRLRIGLPAASALNNAFVPLFERVARAAWKVATQHEVIGREAVAQLRDAVFEGKSEQDDFEVEVVPEIAAQIYGFVVSSSFDPKAANRYLMVDVGAGTVDSSLFKVIPGRGGVWNFEFYTAVVQPYGVANLHAYRVDWWQSVMGATDAANDLLQELAVTKFFTDLGAATPASNAGYFDGIHLSTDDPLDPDREFFDKKLLSQVQGSTLWRAWKDNFLQKHQLTQVPFFLCGGGARSSFYLGLERDLVREPGYSWLSAEPWQLGFPGDLEAEDIDVADFDRLSVAYGLSKANVGRIVQAVPAPYVDVGAHDSFTDRYIDKDQV